MSHRAELIRTAGERDELHGLVPFQTEIARPHDFHMLRDLLDRLCNIGSDIASKGDAPEEDGGHDADSHHDAFPRVLVQLLLAGGHSFINLVNPDARADNPSIRLVGDRVVELRQGGRLSWFREHQLRESASALLAVLNHVADVMVAVRVGCVNTALAFCVPAEEDDVDTFFCVNPEISLAVIIPEVADAVSRFLLRLPARKRSCKFLVAALLDDADGNLRLFLQLTPGRCLKVFPVARETTFVRLHLLADEEASDEERRCDGNAADGRHEASLHSRKFVHSKSLPCSLVGMMPLCLCYEAIHISFSYFTTRRRNAQEPAKGRTDFFRTPSLGNHDFAEERSRNSPAHSFCWLT